MRVMAIDYGDQRIGLAVLDPTGLLCGEAWTMQEWNMERASLRIAEEAARREVGTLVLGLPKNMDGSEGFRADRCREFAMLLGGHLDGVYVAMIDERMTTMSASRYLNETNTRGQKRKGVIDTLSAQIILQNALDRLR